MSIDCGEDRLVFDAGSGIRPAGLALMDEGPRHIHLFMTHTHWDHIQGFPFFGPVYVPGFKITVYAAAGFGKNLEGIFRGQLDKDYFPVQMNDMAAELEFKHLGPEPIRIGDAEVTWEFAQHPGATVRYRVQVPGTSISWIPDNEFLKGYQGSPFDVDANSDLVADYEPMIRFLTDIDVLIHECQYTHEEYATKAGWGHSSIPNACLLAKLCNAHRWVITHHDPMHNDVFPQNKLNLTRQLMRRLGHPTDVSHGFDGWTEHF